MASVSVLSKCQDASFVLAVQAHISSAEELTRLQDPIPATMPELPQPAAPGRPAIFEGLEQRSEMNSEASAKDSMHLSCEELEDSELASVKAQELCPSELLEPRQSSSLVDQV